MRERAKTKRSKIRWRTAQVIILAATLGASPVAATMLAGGSAGVSVFTLGVILVFNTLVPGGVARMVADARKIEWLKALNAELVLDNVRLQDLLEKSRDAASSPPHRHD